MSLIRNNASFCSILSPQFDTDNATTWPSSAKPIWTVISIVNGIASPFTFITNAFIIWTVIRDELFRSSSYNILLAALAVTDFLVGAIVQPMHSWYYACLVSDCIMKCPTVIAMSVIISSGMTVINLMMLSVERYLAIEHPFFYERQVTTKRVLIVAAILWILVPATCISLRLLVDSKGKIIPLLLIMPSIIVIIYCSAKVRATAHSQAKKLNNAAIMGEIQEQFADQQRDVAHQNRPPDDQSQQEKIEMRDIMCQNEGEMQREQEQKTHDSDEKESKEDPAGHEEKKHSKKRLEEYKRLVVMIMVVMASAVFYFPAITVIISDATLGKYVTNDFKHIARPIVLTFINLQSFVDPLLITFRISYMRRSVRKRLPCI